MKKKAAFTLIELLMVIAIIGILAGILIPVVGKVQERANVAASKTQLNNYVNAIQMFKGEYNFFPFVTGGSDSTVDLESQSEEFIKVLSGRDPATGSIDTGSSNPNRRKIAFISFSESEFLLEADNTVSDTQLSDRFNNVKIHLRMDGNGDGRVTPNVSGNNPRQPDDPIRTNITAWVESNAEGAPGYALWD